MTCLVTVLHKVPKNLELQLVTSSVVFLLSRVNVTTSCCCVMTFLAQFLPCPVCHFDLSPAARFFGKNLRQPETFPATFLVSGDTPCARLLSSTVLLSFCHFVSDHSIARHLVLLLRCLSGNSFLTNGLHQWLLFQQTIILVVTLFSQMNHIGGVLFFTNNHSNSDSFPTDESYLWLRLFPVDNHSDGELCRL